MPPRAKVHILTDIRIYRKARTLAFNEENIFSAFRATGINPVNMRRVLESLPNARAKTAAKKIAPPTPTVNTPHHTRAVRHTTIELRDLLKALPDVPDKVHSIVEKLSNAAQLGMAEGEILRNKIEKLEKYIKENKDKLQVQTAGRALTKQQAMSGAQLLSLMEDGGAMDDNAGGSRGRPQLRGVRKQKDSFTGNRRTTDSTADSDSEGSIAPTSKSESELDVIVLNHTRRRLFSPPIIVDTPSPEPYNSTDSSPIGAKSVSKEPQTFVDGENEVARRVLRPRK